MPERTVLRITLTLDGPLVDEHRLPLSEFIRVTRQLRSTLLGVATVLTEEGPSRQAGRSKRFLEEATDLRVVAAPKSGSFALELEVPPASPAAQTELLTDTDAGLSERAVQAFVEGLDALSDAATELPHGFDRGVLQAVLPFRTTLGRGVSSITLKTTKDEEMPRRARIDSETIELTRRLIKKPVRAHAVAEGLLQMVDFQSLECRIDRLPLPSVSCFFDEKDRDRVQAAVRQWVRVAGEGEFAPDQTQPSKLWVSTIEVLYEALTLESQAFWREKDVATLAEEQETPPYALPEEMDDDPWRDDSEASALIAAIKGDD
jgi:hypothetical protein